MADYQAYVFSEDLHFVQAEADLRAMDNSSSEQDQALNAKQAEYQEAATLTAKLSTRAKECKKLIEEIDAPAPVRARVDEIRADRGIPPLDEVRRDQEEAEAKLNCTVDVSHVVLEQYDKRANEVSSSAQGRILELEPELMSGGCAFGFADCRLAGTGRDGPGRVRRWTAEDDGKA